MLLLVHVLLLAWSAVRHSPTPDEIAHVAAGLSHWQTADFSLYRVNPPLARMVATLPIYLIAPDQDKWLSLYVDPGDFRRTEFAVGERFIRVYGTQYFRWITWARWATIPFSVVGAIVCFTWARDLYGIRAGWLALWLWCFSPMVLGFGAIVTPDVPSAATGVLAMYWFWRWLRDDKWGTAYAAGIGLGLAELTKSTWIILPPIMLGLWLLRQLCPTDSLKMEADGQSGICNHSRMRRGVIIRFGRLLRESPKLFSVLLVAWFVLMVGYGFQGAFRPLGQYGFQSELLTGKSDSLEERKIGNRFQGTWLENLLVPLPKQFVVGFDYHKADVAPGNKLAYLRGELRESGWWYYYLYALGIKCTLGGILLFLAATVYRIISIQRWPNVDEWVLLAPMLAVLVLLSYHTGLNKHSRYLLPIFPMAIVWSSQCASLGLGQQKTRNVENSERDSHNDDSFQSARESVKDWRWASVHIGVFLCAGAAACSSLLCYPHSMSYFNELVGGPANGRFHLLNSNVDWGQDLYFLKEQVTRRGWSSVGIATTASYDVSILGIQFFVPPVDPKTRTDSSATKRASDERLQPGRYAISACLIHGYPVSIPDGSGGWVNCGAHAFSYFQEFEPVGMVGYSTLLFDISTDDISSSKTWGSGVPVVSLRSTTG